MSRKQLVHHLWRFDFLKKEIKGISACLPWLLTCAVLSFLLTWWNVRVICKRLCIWHSLSCSCVNKPDRMKRSTVSSFWWWLTYFLQYPYTTLHICAHVIHRGEKTISVMRSQMTHRRSADVPDDMFQLLGAHGPCAVWPVMMMWALSGWHEAPRLVFNSIRELLSFNSYCRERWKTVVSMATPTCGEAFVFVKFRDTNRGLCHGLWGEWQKKNNRPS